MPLLEKLHTLQKFFASGATKPVKFRKEMMQKLKAATVKYENEIFEALFIDLKKSKEESWATENGLFLTELNYAINQLAKWAKPKRVKTNLLNFPSKSYILSEPYGVVLIAAPWNYPFQLLFNPLIGAIAAGNCVVLKASEFAPATSAICKKIITECFPEDYILFVEGNGAEVIPEMMNNFTFDYVFYTGSTAVGKKVYEMAAARLVPVALELGGKSPAVIEADANIEVAARRIALTKFSNCGQMCVAPDYALVHVSVKEKFIAGLKKTIEQFFTTDAAQSGDYGKIINERQFDRLVSYLQQGNIITGGVSNRESLYIAPTIMDDVSLDSPLMQEEIFGPVLPVLTFSNKEEALQIINRHKNPLAFYVFTESASLAEEWTNAVPAGGGCVNNCSVHLTNHHLPFGGRGFSGIGAYHGKASFDAFSHSRALLKSPTWLDPNIKYPPFKGKLNLFKKVIG